MKHLAYVASLDKSKRGNICADRILLDQRKFKYPLEFGKSLDEVESNWLHNYMSGTKYTIQAICWLLTGLDGFLDAWRSYLMFTTASSFGCDELHRPSIEPR